MSLGRNIYLGDRRPGLGTDGSQGFYGLLHEAVVLAVQIPKEHGHGDVAHGSQRATRGRSDVLIRVAQSLDQRRHGGPCFERELP